MASTSAEVFALIASGGGPSSAQIAALADSPDLFSNLVEPLADSFEPDLAEAYAAVFSRILSHAVPEFENADLQFRFGQLRASRPVFEPRRVVVLSRVTLGADVAITSTLLAAAAERWPRARIYFAGSPKNHELFLANERVELLDVRYQRTGSLAERIASGLLLAPVLDDPDTLVIDPDSRLSQLGLLPLADVQRTLFFESRSTGGPEDSLVQITRDFVRQSLGVESVPWISPPTPEWVPKADVAVSLGVGENPAKRVSDAFEMALIQSLLDRGRTVLLDSGAPGTSESVRASRLEAECRGPLILWQGAFAPFAAAIGRSKLYIGYDSAGQHVAAACGVPRITVFNGFPGKRFVARWRPDGPGQSTVLFPSPGLLEEVLNALPEP